MKHLPAKTRFLAAAIAGTALACTGTNSLAAGISFTGLSDSLGLFGSMSFDSSTGIMEFSNPTFAAEATGLSAPFDVKSDTLNVTFLADPGYKITSISFTEAGKYLRVGNGAGTYAGGSMTVNGGTAKSFVPVPASASGIGPAVETDWHVGTGSPVGPVVFAVNSSNAIVTITNVLAAAIQSAGDYSKIWKSDVKIEVGYAPVPLPPALWMLGSALVGLVTVGRRKAEG